jgi:hypothetical protein
MSNIALQETLSQQHNPGIYGGLKTRHRIRLLTLHPASDEDETITCTLTAHDLDKRIPEFTALSYTWGSPENQKSILVNGCSIDITPNLYAGLMHIRRKKSNRVLWIDALCINQEDIFERSRQVPLMRDIYMVAEDVLVWLGPAAESVDASDAAALFKDIAARPYWTRVWIIQEFVLASKVIIQCGHVRVPWDDFYTRFPREARPGRRKNCKMTGVFQLKRTYKPLEQGLDITEALRFSFRSEASNPRDHVYGVLGFVQPNRFVPEFSVDYTLSPCQVYLSVFEYVNRLRAHQRRPLQWPECKDHDRKECDGKECGTRDMLVSIC